jgi:hypothetical protein
MDVPAGSTVPPEIVIGPVFELFVTACAEKDRESFPNVSCTAELLVDEEGSGAAYATVTDLPALIAVARVNWIVVDVGLLIAETVTGAVPFITVNAEPAEIAAAKSSLYVRVKVVPFSAKLGREIKLKIGPVLSKVESLVTACAINVATLFPIASCNALSSGSLFMPGES